MSVYPPLKTAVIMAAGYGSRFFPITKAVQKELLPVLAQPVLDYLVDDCVAAGITRIIFVVRDDDTQVRGFYQPNERLQRFLGRMGKAEKYDQLRQLEQRAEFLFVSQAEADGYGTGIPVRLAQSLLQDELGFLFLAGDDIFLADGSRGVAGELQAHWQQYGTAALVARTVPAAECFRYGIADTSLHPDGFQQLVRLVEKPQPGSISSTLANTSKYILTHAVFDILARQDVNPASGELYITDTLSLLAQRQSVAVLELAGEYLDCGYPAGWLRANILLAQRNPAVWAELEPWLRSFTATQ